MESYHDWLDSEHQPQGHINSSPKRKRPRSERTDSFALRTAIACNACRERKSRCSGDQPTCHYCEKVGAECVYSQTGSVKLAYPIPSATFDEWGTKILKAIDQLAGSLDVARPCNLGDTSIVESTNRNPSEDEETDFFSIFIEPQTPITDISSILSWNVFGSSYDRTGPFHLSRKYTSRHHKMQKRGQESGSTAVSDLINLSRCFMSYYLPAMVVIHMPTLEGYIAQIGENGAEWTAESCLVFLVAALGSICQQGQTNFPDPNDTAFRYWNMAKKRLGWALEEDSLISAQCLYLAGIWHLRNSEPINAYRMFHTAIISLTSRSPGHNTNEIEPLSDGNVEFLEQKILETCLIFECQLRIQLELSVPPTQGPYIVRIPYPTNSVNTTSEGEQHVPSINLSLLQIRQKTLKSFKTLHTQMSWKEISDLSNELAITQHKLDQWFEALPPDLKFSTTVGEEIDTRAPDDYRKTLLQGRYLEVKELILRPWLYICLNTNSIEQTPMQSGSSTLDNAMNAHFLTESREKAVQHQMCALLRLKHELGIYKKLPFSLVEGPWLRAKDVLLLALLLLGPHRQRSGTSKVSELMHASWSSAIASVEALFRANDASDCERQYASLLQSLLQ